MYIFRSIYTCLLCVVSTWLDGISMSLVAVFSHGHDGLPLPYRRLSTLHTWTEGTCNSWRGPVKIPTKKDDMTLIMVIYGEIQ